MTQGQKSTITAQKFNYDQKQFEDFRYMIEISRTVYNQGDNLI